MKADIKEIVKKQIQFSLNLLPSPDERIEVLTELIPGEVKMKESREMCKIRISAILDKKAKWQMPKKSTKKAKQ